MDRVPERILMGQFLHGLKEDIKAEVRQMGPATLEQAMDHASRAEEKIRVLRGSRMGFSSSPRGGNSLGAQVKGLNYNSPRAQNTSPTNKTWGLSHTSQYVAGNHATSTGGNNANQANEGNTATH